MVINRYKKEKGMSRKEEYKADALVPDGDEGRGRLR